MSATNVAALAIAGVIVVGFIIAICWDEHRIKQADAQQAVCVATTIPDPAPMPAVPVTAVVETTPGFNLDLADECDRILAATNDHEAQLAAGCDRLWAAIHDEQTKGETA